MIGKALDKLAGVLSPSWGLKRMQARATMAQINEFIGTDGGYDAAKLNRFTKYNRGSNASENVFVSSQAGNLRAMSWKLYRNNPHARKAINTINAKVIGRGPRPQSQSLLADGSPHKEFRDKAKELWKAVQDRIDWRGRPGKGGQSLVDIQKTALRGTILGGEVLANYRPVSEEEQRSLDLPIPLQIQLVHAERLDEDKNGADQFYGIEFEPGTLRRSKYWILNDHPSSTDATIDMSTDVPAGMMSHLYVSDDIDQHRGTPWFSSMLMRARNLDDYEYNEIVAAAMSACVVLAYNPSPGQTQFGLQPSSGSTDEVTDADGNPITKMQPGMMVRGEVNGFNPMRPNSGAGEFIGHMLRSEAAAMPGVKGSTLTMDYRQSSFSSERSADNDIWPELEGLQDWFSSDFLQPAYEQVIISGVLSGWFDGVVNVDQFLADRQNFLSTQWQGPVARSINPKDDAAAARSRIQNGTSTPQIEAAKLGQNTEDVLKGLAEFIAMAEALNLPQSVIDQALGIVQQDIANGDESQETGTATQAA